MVIFVYTVYLILKVKFVSVILFVITVWVVILSVSVMEFVIATDSEFVFVIYWSDGVEYIVKF